jgi:hypothetical protein
MLSATNSKLAEQLPVDQREIPANLDRLECHLNILRDRVELLRTRLSPVLNQVEETKKLERVSPSAETQIGDQINSSLYRVEVIYDLVDDLLNRVEI